MYRFFDHFALKEPFTLVNTLRKKQHKEQGALNVVNLNTAEEFQKKVFGADKQAFVTLIKNDCKDCTLVNHLIQKTIKEKLHGMFN